MDTKTKIAVIFITSVITFGCIFYGVEQYLNARVNAYVFKLAEKISDKVGHTVTIKSVSVKRHWLNLNVHIKELEILDNNTKAPIFAVGNIVSTVDTLKSMLTFSIKFKHLLLQNPRVIIRWDGIEPPTVIGLSKSNVTEDINLTQFLYVLALQHRVTIENGDIHILGINQTDLPLMNVKLDFNQQATDEYLILLRGGIAAATPQEFNAAVHYVGRLDDPYKFMLDFEIKTSNLQIDSLLNLIPKYKQNLIQGAFSDLNIKGTVQNGTLRNINTDFAIEQLTIGSELMFSSGEGKVEFRPIEDHIHLTARNLQLHDSKKPDYAVNIDTISGDVKSNYKDQILELSSDNIEVKLLDMEILSEISSSLQYDKLISLNFESKFTNGKVPNVLKCIPDRLFGKTLAGWLKRSLINGEVKQSSLEYTDDGVFWKTDLEQAELKFSQDWPSIHSIDAAIVLDHNKLTIDTKHARVLNTTINALSTNFKPVRDKPFAKVEIKGNLDTDIKTGLTYLQQTPLKANIADKLAVLQPAGEFHLDLELDLDFSTSESTVAVQGNLALNDGSMQIPELKLPLTNIFANFKFTNNSLLANNIKLQLFDRPAKAEIVLAPDKSHDLKIKLAAPIEVTALQKMFSDLNFQHVSGSSEFEATLEMPWNADGSGRVLTVQSNLIGISSEYPAPFNKLASNKLPLQLKYLIKDSGDKTIYVKLNNLLNANLLVRDSKLIGGHIAFSSGKEVPAISKNLLVSGKLANLDWDEWEKVLNKDHKASSPLVDIDMWFGNLKFRGEKYTNLWVKYDATSNIFKLDNDMISGTIQISKEEDKYDIRLEKLNLVDTKVGNNRLVKILKEKHKQKQLPVLQFYCENLNYAKTIYRKVNLHLLPRTYGYEIMDLSASNDNILFQAQGQWQMEPKDSTQLSGNAYTKNLGKIVQDWNYGKSISKGNGELNFSLQWDGDPTQFEIIKLNGNSHLELQDGVITGVKPGLGRVIGLLSIEAMPRRLNLDFSDIMSKGYTFDTLTSDFKLKDGVVSSEKVIIKSPSARIEIYGSSDLKTHALDLTMNVSPTVGVGLPVAAAIAVANPLVGAAVWLFDQASGSKISEITKFKYRVSGTWEAPQMDEIDAKNEVKKSP